MAGNPPWTPHLNGSALSNFPSLKESIDRDSVPTRDEHPGWTQAAFAESFPSSPFDDALWDTVLALWRLRFDVDQDADKTLWEAYVCAYLRRHVLLCNGRSPFSSVRDLAAELGRRPGFPAKDIPHRLKDDPTGPVNPTKRPRPPSPHVEAQPLVEYLSETQTVDGDDQEIDQLLDSDSLGSAPAGLGPVPSASDGDLPVPPRSKRRRAQVYVQVPRVAIGVPKRRAVHSRARSEDRKPPKKLTSVKGPRPGDLRYISVEENSQVDTKMLPNWEDEPCTQCATTKTRSESCIPLWRYPGDHTRVGSMWCNHCRRDGVSNCSFVPSKFGVRHLPVITPVATGDTRRQREASHPKPPPRSDTRNTSRQKSKSAMKPPSTTSTVLPSRSGTSRGSVESIVLGDFVPFQNSLQDQSRSSLSLEAARINLRTMMSTEMGSLNVLTQTIMQRQQTLSNLEKRFTRDIRRLRAEEGGGGSSSDEKADMGPGEDLALGRRRNGMVRVVSGSVVEDSEEERIQ